VYGDTRGDRAAHRAVVEAIRAARPDLVVFTGDALSCFPVGHMPDLGPLGVAVPLWPQALRGYPAFSLLTLVPFPALLHQTLLAPFHPPRDPDGFDGFLEDTAPLRLGDGVPLLFVPGNHDLYHRFDRAEVARLFGAPGRGGGRDPGALWHAVDAGPLRLLVLDTGTDLAFDADPIPPGGPQLRWLDAALARAEADGVPAIVALHLPPFSSAAEDGPVPWARERIVEGILDRHAVPLILCGHAHAYERIERRDPTGRTQLFVVTGGGGAPFHTEAPPARRDPGSRAFVEGVLHFVLLEVGAHSIRGRAFAVEAPSRPLPRGFAPGAVLDQFQVPIPGR